MSLNWPVCSTCCERLYNPTVNPGMCTWCKRKGTEGWVFIGSRLTKASSTNTDRVIIRERRFKKRPTIQRLAKKTFIIDEVKYELRTGVSITYSKEGAPILIITRPKGGGPARYITLVKGDIMNRVNEANEMARVLWEGITPKNLQESVQAKLVGDKRYLIDGVEYQLAPGVMIKQDKGAAYVSVKNPEGHKTKRTITKLTKKDHAKQIEDANNLSCHFMGIDKQEWAKFRL